MSKKNHIPYETVSDGKLPMHDFDDAYVDVPDRPNMIKPRKKRFSETAFGRTILLKNKTGKLIAGVLTTGIGIFTGIDLSPIINPLTGGNDMDFLFDAGIIEIAITAITFLLVAGVSWIGAYFKLPRKFTVKIERFLHVASEEIEKAVSEESEKGRKITKNEIYNGLIIAFKKTFGANPEELTNAK